MGNVRLSCPDQDERISKFMSKMMCAKWVAILAASFIMAAAVARANPINLIHSFVGTDGAQPNGGVVQAGNTLFGVTTVSGGTTGGKANTGTTFSVNTDGSQFTNLNTFGPVYFNSALNISTNVGGANPVGTPVLSSNTLYGATLNGGLYGYGVIYSINTNGMEFTVLWNFSGTNGASAYPSLALAGGTLFGATEAGGTGNYGTVYKINTDGMEFTVLKNFIYTNGNYPDGGGLYGGLVVSNNVIYGTASLGGTNGYGLVFSMDTGGGNFSDLHSFQGTDGIKPFSGLTLSGTTLYGTTYQGGTDGGGTVYALNMDGSGFGVLHNFTNDPDGSSPEYGAPAVVGSILYGTTYAGGTGAGVVYQINTGGTGFSVIYDFVLGGTNGYDPVGGVLASGDTLIGTTFEGGTTGVAGTVYALELTPLNVVIDFIIGSPESSGTPLQFSYHGTPGAKAIIQASEDLHTWDSLETNTLGTGSMVFTDSLATNFLKRFYRIALP
jgi:uncharacterized repeat protein (TIGR03803 family)